MLERFRSWSGGMISTKERPTGAEKLQTNSKSTLKTPEKICVSACSHDQTTRAGHDSQRLQKSRKQQTHSCTHPIVLNVNVAISKVNAF